jgi:hypothetical protein
VQRGGPNLTQRVRCGVRCVYAPEHMMAALRWTDSSCSLWESVQLSYRVLPYSSTGLIMVMYMRSRADLGSLCLILLSIATLLDAFLVNLSMWFCQDIWLVSVRPSCV